MTEPIFVPRIPALVLAVSLLPSALGGCSLLPGGGRLKSAADAIVEAGIADRRSFNDEKAETLLALPCDISVAAFYRLQNAVQQEALAMLCSGRRKNEGAPQLGY
jgi:hypothetical protein